MDRLIVVNDALDGFFVRLGDDQINLGDLICFQPDRSIADDSGEFTIYIGILYLDAALGAMLPFAAGSELDTQTRFRIGCPTWYEIRPGNDVVLLHGRWLPTWRC